QSEARPQAPYQVVREYRLFGAKSSGANSNVVAEVDFKPPSSKDYHVQKSSGSSRGQQVVRRILDHEVEAAAKPNQARTDAVTSDNYDFTYIDRKSTRLNSSHVAISYAVFCLKKKKIQTS